MTTTVRTPRHVEQDLTNKPTEKTPYELACESGFLGSLSAEEHTASKTNTHVKKAISRKHAKKCC